jgi:hypothetical protein
MNEQKLTFQFDNQQFNIIMSGLAKLPIEMGLETFEWMKEQAKQQLESSVEAPKDPLSSKVIK